MSLSKKLRFEVFKRDKFVCQYCGQKAPDVILHTDHIHPKSKGGKDDALNLVTACEGCNLGKGARLLDDSAAIDRQHARLEELQERREQMDMMLEWRNGLENLETDTVDLVCNHIESRGEFGVNKSGRSYIRRWLKKYSFDEILSAIDRSFDYYMKWDGDKPNEDAWGKAFEKIPAVCSITRQEVEKPYLTDILYIQGILRNRFNDRRGNYFDELEQILLSKLSTITEMKSFAAKADDWDQFCCFLTGKLEEGLHQNVEN